MPLLLTAILASVLSGTLLIPSIRPLLSTAYPGAEWLMHAFVASSLLGGVLVAPGLSARIERSGRRRPAGVALALLDALCLAICALHPPPAALLAARLLGGAANLAGLSLVMSAVPETSENRNRAYGLAGAATIAGVALGAPLGTLLLPLGPSAALWAGAALELVVAGALARLPLPVTAEPRARAGVLLAEAPLLRAAAAWVFVERFAVGCFVVSFALWARQVHGLGDRMVGLHYSLFLVPFALALYPVGRLADRLGRAVFLGNGLLAYGLAFLLLPAAPTLILWSVLLVAGLASAAIYGPALSAATEGCPPGARSTAMALLNAAGSLGMLLGTSAAGLLTQALKPAWGPGAHAVAFVLGALPALAARALAGRRLAALERADRASARPRP